MSKVFTVHAPYGTIDAIFSNKSEAERYLEELKKTDHGKEYCVGATVIEYGVDDKIGQIARNKYTAVIYLSDSEAKPATVTEVIMSRSNELDTAIYKTLRSDNIDYVIGISYISTEEAVRLAKELYGRIVLENRV